MIEDNEGNTLLIDLGFYIARLDTVLCTLTVVSPAYNELPARSVTITGHSSIMKLRDALNVAFTKIEKERNDG